MSLFIAWGLWSGHVRGGRLKKRRKSSRRDAARSPSFTSRALGGGSGTMAVLAIMFLLVEVPIVAYGVSPKWAADLVTNLRDWAHGHSRVIGIAVSAAVGLWLIVTGLVNL